MSEEMKYRKTDIDRYRPENPFLSDKKWEVKVNEKGQKVAVEGQEGEQLSGEAEEANFGF